VTWALERAEAADDVPVLGSMAELPAWLLAEDGADG
jgi:hypothetical protein